MLLLSHGDDAGDVARSLAAMLLMPHGDDGNGVGLQGAGGGIGDAPMLLSVPVPARKAAGVSAAGSHATGGITGAAPTG